LALAKILAAWLICFEKSMVALLSLLAYTVFSKASAASDLRTGIDLIAIAITYKLLVTKIMTSIDNYYKLYAKKREPSILPIGMLGQNDKPIAATTLVFLEQANRAVGNNPVHRLPYHTTGKMIFSNPGTFGNTDKLFFIVAHLLLFAEITGSCR